MISFFIKLKGPVSNLTVSSRKQVHVCVTTGLLCVKDVTVVDERGLVYTCKHCWYYFDKVVATGLNAKTELKKFVWIWWLTTRPLSVWMKVVITTTKETFPVHSLTQAWAQEVHHYTQLHCWLPNGRWALLTQRSDCQGAGKVKQWVVESKVRVIIERYKSRPHWLIM